MHPDEKRREFLVINSRVVHSVQCPRQCKEMLIQIPYPMMKRFIPQIDGLEFVCEKSPEESTGWIRLWWREH